MVVVSVSPPANPFQFIMDPFLQYLFNICENIRYILCDSNISSEILRDLWNEYNIVKENTDNFKRTFNETAHEPTTVLRFTSYINPEQTVSMTIEDVSNLRMILETVHMQLQLKTPNYNERQ